MKKTLVYLVVSFILLSILATVAFGARPALHHVAKCASGKAAADGGRDYQTPG